MRYCIVLLTFVITTTSKSLPPYIKKCRLSDPDLKTCLDSAVVEAVDKFAAGNKELGIIQLEPLFINKADLGTTPGSVNIHQVFENVTLYNASKASVQTTEIKIDDNELVWNFKTHTPSVKMEADYKMEGQYLVFPVNGHGKCKILLCKRFFHFLWSRRLYIFSQPVKKVDIVHLPTVLSFALLGTAGKKNSIQTSLRKCFRKPRAIQTLPSARFINFALDDIEGDYKARCEMYTKKNKTHLRLTDFDFSLTPKNVVYDFENIIDGNEQLSKELVKTLNENALDVYKDIGAGFNEVLGIVWKSTINEVFSRVPLDELFLP